METVHINPKELHVPLGYSHAISVSGPSKTIYIGGQDAVDVDGRVVGVGDLRVQTEQVLSNIETLLAAAGAGFEHVVKFGIYIREGQDPREGFAAFQAKWVGVKNDPTITAVFVAALGHPDWLVEIDGVAVVPEG